MRDSDVNILTHVAIFNRKYGHVLHLVCKMFLFEIMIVFAAVAESDEPNRFHRITSPVRSVSSCASVLDFHRAGRLCAVSALRLHVCRGVLQAGSFLDSTKCLVTFTGRLTSRVYFAWTLIPSRPVGTLLFCLHDRFRICLPPNGE